MPNITVKEKFNEKLSENAAVTTQEFIEKYKLTLSNNKLFAGFWGFFSQANFGQLLTLPMGLLVGSASYKETQAQQNVLEYYQESNDARKKTALDSINAYKNLSLVEVILQSGILSVSSVVAASLASAPIFAIAGIGIASVVAAIRLISRGTRTDTMRNLVESANLSPLDASKNFIASESSPTIAFASSGIEQISNVGIGLVEGIVGTGMALSGMFSGNLGTLLTGGLIALTGASQLFYTGIVGGPELDFYLAAEKAFDTNL